MYIIGVDIGTTGTKAVLADHDGKVVCSSYKGYGLLKGAKGQVEQSASDWWDAFVFTVRECTSKVTNSKEITAISVSSQGGCLVPVDKSGRPLCNSMTWMDTRSTSQHDRLLEMFDESYYYRKTGWKLSPALNLCKIKFLAEEDQELFSRTAKFLSTIDYINLKLIGEAVIDPSNAAMTQLYHIGDGVWDQELLRLAGISEAKLPKIASSGKKIGHLTGQAATELGLDMEVSIISGGHDQYCASVGCGTVDCGQVMLSTGTAWAILGVTGTPVFNEYSYISPGPHIVGSLWGALATIPTAGVCMEWFRNNFADFEKAEGQSGFEEIDAGAAKSMMSCADLIFYPYFCGTGFPDHKISAKASLTGLSLEHNKFDFARAIMEGIAFQLKYALEKYRPDCRSLRVIGGASKSTLWMDILTNVLEIDVVTLTGSNAACIGAAIVAGVGEGIYADYKSAYDKFSGEGYLVPKDTMKQEFYRQKFEKYKTGMAGILDSISE